ncbi:MAG: flagellar basal body-associated FliL family protein [Thiomonas sp.]|nr:flagellar basal body-associated FliL family protein [Thiomonas sp.]
MAEQESKAKEKGGGKTKLIIIILVAVIVLMAGGGAAAFFLMKPKAAPTAAELAAQAAADKAKNMRFISMEPFVTNLQSTDGNVHYLQVKIDLKTYDPSIEAKVKLMTPELRNNILRILSAQSSDKIETVEGRDHLRQDILQSVNKVLEGAPAAAAAEGGHGGVASQASSGHGGAPIDGVFFTAFVVQ